MINIYINNQAVKLPKNSSLLEVIEDYKLQLENEPTNIAVVVNEHIVPKSQWAQHLCQSQDKIDIFNPVAGG